MKPKLVDDAITGKNQPINQDLDVDFIKSVYRIEKKVSPENKHRQFLNLYADRGLRFSESLHEEKNSWIENYTDSRYSPNVNLIERLPNVCIIEFDAPIDEHGTELKGEDVLQPDEAHKQVLKFIKKKGWRYFVSTHKGKCPYIWLEFNAPVSEEDLKQFLMWICPKGARIDTNFSSSIKVFPVLYAPHRKHPHNEMPIAFSGGSKINFKSLKIPKSNLKVKNTKTKDGYNYETFQKDSAKKTLGPSKELFLKTKNIFKKYLDTTDINYNLLSIWTLGTFFHNQFETFPILILTARKQCGKTRALKLISSLSYGSEGSISTSVTETFLFRHKDGAVFFDEMESLSSKEKGALREIINATYKRGNRIIRYTEKKINGEKSYAEDTFFPFYPLGLANIYGFGDVLSDRSLQVILQRSSKKQTRLIEDFSTNPEILALKKNLGELHAEIPQAIFSQWNQFIETGNVSEEMKPIFNKILKTNLSGRPLELSFPLCLVAEQFGVLDLFLSSLSDYMQTLEGEGADNPDDLLQTFMEQANYSGFVGVSSVLQDFRSYLENPEDWINSKWLGRALKRLGFISKKRLVNGHVQIELNINSTNATNSINTTNSTNSTKNKEKEKVELVDNVELIGIVDTNSNNQEIEFSELNKEFKNG